MTKLVRCPSCASLLAAAAARCSHCGHVLRGDAREKPPVLSVRDTTNPCLLGWLVGVSAEVEGTAISLRGESVTLGTAPTNDVTLNLAEAEPKAALLRFERKNQSQEGTGLAITLMNEAIDVRLEERVLEPGRQIEISDAVTLKIRDFTFNIVPYIRTSTVA